jgi:NAD(P)-dependent dehydrogenase (short-subunit alcohol dehydrogenase family)
VPAPVDSPPVAIVTGGAGGLGRFVSRTLPRDGWHVLAADRDGAAGAALARDIAADGGTVTFGCADVADPAELRTVTEQAIGLGPLGVLVNLAGGWSTGPQYPDGDGWQASIAFNLVTPMLATQLCLRSLAAAGGSVVNVSSSAALGPSGYRSPEYAAAKAGLIRFTTATADFAERYGVRVSCVVPHWIGLARAHREYRAMSPEEQRASGGLVDPQAVADAVVSLVHDPGAAGKVVELQAGQAPDPTGRAP